MSHLNSEAWYIDCGTTYTPLHEVELKQSREAIGVSWVEMIDLDAIEDEDVWEKALNKRFESDRKKAQKVREAEEKAELKEKERLEKAAEKANKKGKKKVPAVVDMEGKTLVPANSTVDFGLQLHTVSTRGTKREYSYEHLTQQRVLVSFNEEESTADEFIINSFLADVLGGENGPLPPS